MAQSDRRGFFKDLLRAAASAAQDVQSAMRDLPDLGLDQEPWESTWEPPRPIKIGPARKTASDEEIAALCTELGLEKRTADVLRLAQSSVRLTRSEAAASEPGASRLGSSPDLPPGFVWPTWRDGDLTFL